MENNILLNTDSYKASHYLQYPPGTQRIYSYIESRGGEYDRTVFFGLQGFIKEYLEGPVVTIQKIDEAQEFWTAHGLPFDRSIWTHILFEHDGMLPVEIRALPEGTTVPVGTPLVTVVNTDPKCFWLTSFLETALLRAVWYPTTVATISAECRRTIKRYLSDTADSLEGLPFKLHDFGSRGVSSCESAAIGGASHLLNFMGSDTVSGIRWLQKNYGADEMPAFSIPAAEHSTITSWGQLHETDAYANMVDQFGSGSLYAVVSDSYDLMNAVNNIWGDELREKVLAADGTLVVRPDSGDPATIVRDTVHALYQKFGGTVNSKGYKLLNDKVRVIQGDGIDNNSIDKILKTLTDAGFSADNVAFGMGGALLQHCDRDTQRFAMKCSAIQKNDVWNTVQKTPKTDPSKASKGGRFAVIKNEKDEEVTVIQFKEEFEMPPYQNDLLEVVFVNGELTRDESLATIRSRTMK